MNKLLYFRGSMNNRYIIIFDGVCNFCNGAVNFIIKHDPNGVFAFTPMQSDIAQKLIAEYQVEKVGFDTFLLIKDNTCYFRTDAAIEITKNLSGYWHLFRVFKILPRPIRDYFYRVFARNRYNLFGKMGSCMVPTLEVKSRFIE